MACRPILIVEDEPDLRATLQDLLELDGFKVVTAANGREALTRLEEIGQACLILLDLMMPVMNGWQFLDAIKNSQSKQLMMIPVVVVSAAADLSAVQQQYGCRALKKPFDIAHLMQLANEHCEIS